MMILIGVLLFHVLLILLCRRGRYKFFNLLTKNNFYPSSSYEKHAHVLCQVEARNEWMVSFPPLLHSVNDSECTQFTL